MVLTIGIVGMVGTIWYGTNTHTAYYLVRETTYIAVAWSGGSLELGVSLSLSLLRLPPGHLTVEIDSPTIDSDSEMGQTKGFSL
jgi:hypothetical protein